MVAWVVDSMEDVYQEKMINLGRKWKLGVLTCPGVQGPAPLSNIVVEVPV